MIKPDFSRYRSILLMRTDRIGDLLVTTPCIRALRRHLPDASIDLLASPLNRAAVQGNPHLDHVFTFDLHSPLKWPGLIRSLRRASYDAALAFNSNSRNGSALLSLLGIPERIAFSGLPSRGGRTLHRYARAYTWVCPGSGQEHVILDMLAKLEALGVPPDSPHLDFLVPADLARSLAERFPDEPGRPRVALFIGNIRKTQNRWPVEKFRELTLRLLDAEPDLRLVVFGGPSDRPLFQAFADLSHPRLGRFIGATLQESGAFLQRCRALVAGSSGPTHIAAALDIPVLAVVTRYNATVWPPLIPGCMSVTPDDDIRDMRGIPVDQVESMVRTFLAEDRARRSGAGS